MPRLNGIEAARQTKAVLPQVHFIALSMHRAAGMAQDIRAAGACRYLAKTAAPAELVRLIRTCLPGS